eukprot:scpid62976/ scgid20929/ 
MSLSSAWHNGTSGHKTSTAGKAGSSKTHRQGSTSQAQSSARKPAWDSTVSDLNSLRASKAELEHRHVVHQSHNTGLTPTLASRQGRCLDRTLSLSSSTLASASSVSDSRKMTAGERAFSAVQDLFGDDPKRYSSSVHLTPTPAGPRLRTSNSRLERSLPGADGSYNGSLFGSSSQTADSSSVMSPFAALNDSSLTESDGNMETSTVGGCSSGSPPYRSQLGDASSRIAPMSDLRQFPMATAAETSSPQAGHAPITSMPHCPRSDSVQPSETARAAQFMVDGCGGDKQEEVVTERLDRIADSVRQLSTPLEQLSPGKRESLSASDPAAASFHGHSGLLLETILMLTSHLKESEVRAARQDEQRQLLSRQAEHQQILLDGLASDMLQMKTTQEHILRQHARMEHALQDLQVEVAESLRQSTESFQQLVEGTRQYQPTTSNGMRENGLQKQPRPSENT